MSTSLSRVIEDANATLIASADLNAVATFFAPDYVVHLTGKVLTGGHATVHSTLSAMTRAFSNIHVKVEVLLEDANKIAWQRTMTATHTGPYKGFLASGREIVWRDMVVSQFEGSLIKEEWVSTDLAEQLLLARKHKVK